MTLKALMVIWGLKMGGIFMAVVGGAMLLEGLGCAPGQTYTIPQMTYAAGVGPAQVSVTVAQQTYTVPVKAVNGVKAPTVVVPVGMSQGVTAAKVAGVGSVPVIEADVPQTMVAVPQGFTPPTQPVGTPSPTPSVAAKGGGQ